MKSAIRRTLFLSCLIPACGGREGDDELDNSITTSVGGSIVETSATQVVTGGASFEHATGGSSATLATGGASIASTTAIAVTGGASSIATATGGTTSTTVATATGGTTGVLTTTAAATGGLSSVGSTGGSASATGGMNATGGATSSVCKPELHIVLLSQNTETVLPGAKSVQTLKFEIEALCIGMEITRMDFDLASPDFDVSDSRPFWHTTVDGLKHNLTNVKLIAEKTGATLSEPVETELYTSNQQAHLAFTDSFHIEANTAITATIVLDVSPEFNSPLVNTQYMVGFDGASTNDATVPLVVTSTPDFPYTAGASSFTVSNEKGQTKLVLEYGEDPVPQNIVTPNKDHSPIITTNYLVRSEGPLDERISDITIEQTNPNGKLSDCDQIITSVDGQICATISTSGLPLNQNSLSVHLSETSCGKIIKPNRYTTTDMKISCIVADPISSSLAQTTDPKSGDIFALKATSITASDGGNGTIINHEAHSMVLRKAKPVVTILPLNETKIRDGATMELFKFQIASSSNGEPIDFRDFSLSFNVSDLDSTERISVVNLHLSKQETELRQDEAQVGDSKGYNAVTYGGKISYEISPNVSIVNDLGTTYTATGEVNGAQIGDTISISFTKSQATQSFTGYLCDPASGIDQRITDTADQDACNIPSTPWMKQGDFLWSDMSDPVYNKDWTDDYLVQDLNQTVTLTY